MVEFGPCLLFHEVHEGDIIYRMWPAVPHELPGNVNMTPANPAARASLEELAHLPRWTLFQDGGQVCNLGNPQWRVDIQARSQLRYLWAFQGPPGPPTYAIVRADRDIERFGEALVKGVVKKALWDSMDQRNTWNIRVEVLRKDERKRPQHGDIFIKTRDGIPPTLQRCNQATVLQETKINGDVPNLFRCREQQPNKAAIPPDLADALAEFLRLWADVFELWASAQALAGLASSMASSDTAHGAVETTAGGLGVVGGSLMIGGIWFPPLLIAGAIVGGVSAVGGLTNAAIDHSGTSSAHARLMEHHENILAKLKDIEMAEKALKATAKVQTFVDQVEAGSSEVLAEYLRAAGTLVSDVTCILAACCMAAPKLAAEGGKHLLTAGNLAKLPTVGLQSTVSTASTAASTADLVVESTAVASGGRAAVTVGGAASKIAAGTGGVLGIAAGAVQLGFGINRLANGSSTTAEISKLCEDAKSIARSSQSLATGCTALLKCAHQLEDTTALMWMVSDHVGHEVSLE
jgi:hypothetical protein